MALSLRGRLVATTVVAALAAVTVLVVGLQVLLAHQTTRDSLTALRGRADAAASTVRFRGDRTVVLEATSDSLDQDLWVYDPHGERIDGTTPPRSLRTTVARLSRAWVEDSVDVDSLYRVLARPVTRPAAGRGAVVVAALDLDPYEDAERRELYLSLALGLVAVVTAGAGAWTASGVALHRVRRMARRADDWREHDLTGRFDLGTPRDELTELGDTLDRMLDRIAQALLTERRLTDEVAHELRTPLAVIRSEAQLAGLQAPHDPTTAESLAAILAATERMAASIDTMLAVARDRHRDDAACRLGEVLDELRGHRTDRSGLVVEVEDSGLATTVLGAPLRVVHAAVVPLLDNAVRHAGSAVRVWASTQGRRVLLHVEDDGPGVPPADRDAIFEPGRSTGAGAGLGLALARRLAHSVGGEVEARDDGHGHFVLSLPRP